MKSQTLLHELHADSTYTRPPCVIAVFESTAALPAPAVARMMANRLLGTICMFVSGHLDDGAHLVVEAGVAGDALITDFTFFTFSLGSSLKDMYEAGAYPLVFLIGTFSGVWPYLKCLLLLYSWFAPPWLFRPKQRGQTLQLLDILGKWSLIDIYVLVLCMIYVSSKWKENYGQSGGKSGGSMSNALSAIFENKKILLCGLICSSFESSMFIFVFNWTPAFTATVSSPPFGLIFACFMVSERRMLRTRKCMCMCTCTSSAILSAQLRLVYVHL